jgi:hypothetical protein
VGSINDKKLFLEGPECEVSVGVQSCPIQSTKRVWFGKKNLWLKIVELEKQEYRSARREENIRFV